MTQLTDADYNIDMDTLMATMGIDPMMLAKDSAQLRFVDGKALLSYTVVRAIPPRVLGVAMLRSATTPEPQSEEPVGEDPPFPRLTPAKKPARKRAAKKATPK